MNIFHIPSWYPSINHPLSGRFFYERSVLQIRDHGDLSYGISTWGQNDERFLLQFTDGARVIQKAINSLRIREGVQNENERLRIYFKGSFTWSWKFMRGNMHGIIRSNERNLNHFEKDFGKADLIHARVAFPAGYIAMKLSEKTGIPYIIHEHMSPFPFKYFIKRNGMLADRIRLPYAYSRANIAVSQALAEKMRAQGVPRVRTIYNPVDEALFVYTPAFKSVPFRFFGLGRMVEQKGIDILLQAIAQIPEDYPLSFTIAGEGPQLLAYKKLAEKLGIASRITWPGLLSREESVRHFRDCHAFVLPSRHESMGMVFAEAIATGRPVIGTVCGGPEEIINDTNGYLVPPEDPHALADAMMRMVDNYDRFDQASIRADFEQRFSSRVITREIYDLYKEVISRHSAK